MSTGNIIQIMDMGEGSRVELDLIDMLSEDEGLLVSDTARGYFLVLAETRPTPTYPPRPFRINAGAVHQYVKMADGSTKYLSEVEPGDRVLVSNGNSEREVAVGRVKIEKRPFEKICLDSGISATLQKADSIYIKGENEALHLLDVQDNDGVFFLLDEDFARHKGMPVEEEILEK